MARSTPSEPPRGFFGELVRRRRLVRAILPAVALLFALAIPNLRMHFAPEELVAPDAEALAASAAMREAFGDDEDALLVLVSADDVRGRSVLDWSHRLARSLEGVRGIARVESLGTTPLPRALRDDELTLEALAHGDEARETARRAIEQLVAADPARFPEGLATLAMRGAGELVVEPLVSGEGVEAADVEAITAALERSELLTTRLVGRSGTLLVVAAMLERGADEEGVAELVAAVEAQLERRPPPSGVHARLAGLPVMRASMVQALERDQVTMVLLAFAGSFIVLLVGMRSAVGVLLPLAVVGITLAITMGAMALTGQPIDLLTNVVPPLLVTIGLSDAVHLVLRYRDERVASAGSDDEAAVRTASAMWLPCLVTALTTSIGFAALIVGGTPILARFGIIASLAAMLSYAVMMLFVPAALPDFAPPRLGMPGRASRGLDRAVMALSTLAVRAPGHVIAVAVALFVASVALGRDVVVDSRLLDQFASDSELAALTRLLERELGGVRSLSIGVEGAAGHYWSPAGIGEIAALEERLSAEPGVLRVTSHRSYLDEAFRLVTGERTTPGEAPWNAAQLAALHALVASGPTDPTLRYATADGSRARLEVRLEDRGANEILALVARIEAFAESEGLRVQPSGEAWEASLGLARIVESLGGLASAVALIFFVMTLLFRSARLGVISVPPNALPLAMTLGYMALRGIPLHAGTVIVFTVTVGLAVDGATHVIARYREECLAAGGAGPDVLLRAMASSGRGVVLSAATLLIGYAALLGSSFEPVRLFGELSAVAIGSALLAQLVLLPALLARFAGPMKPQRPMRPSRLNW